MPGSYAHYRFGTELLRQLSPQQQRTIGRFRQLYDMGLHGPDLFYYADSLGIATDGKLGMRFHGQSGQVFFEHLCRNLRLQPTEGAMAYLYGLLAHYVLDSIYQPFVQRNVNEKRTSTQIFAEFDRYLLVVDGKKPAHLYDCSRHIALTVGESETVARFYPGVSPAQVRKFSKNMAKTTRALVMPKGAARKARLTFLQLTAPKTAQRVMGLHPNRECVGLNLSMLRLYELAVKRYSVLLDQLLDHLRKNTPLGVDFAAPFGE